MDVVPVPQLSDNYAYLVIDPTSREAGVRLRAEAEPGKSLVVTGHMATDSIGINRVIAGLEEQGIEVTRTSGIVAPG